jgi:hypothetical protein
MNKEPNFEDFILSADQIAGIRGKQASGRNGQAVHRRPKQSALQFYKFPAEVMRKLIESNLEITRAVLVILLALFEENYRDYDHRNPVRLTSWRLREYGISPTQKKKALETLEKAGSIVVRRRRGENPMVTLRWLPIKH